MASSGRINPGDKGKISIAVNAAGMFGKISKSVQVYSNDPQKPRVVLKLMMNVNDAMHSPK